MPVVIEKLNNAQNFGEKDKENKNLENLLAD
jgi:hypothetical protein